MSGFISPLSCFTEGMDEGIYFTTELFVTEGRDEGIYFTTELFYRRHG